MPHIGPLFYSPPEHTGDAIVGIDGTVYDTIEDYQRANDELDRRLCARREKLAKRRRLAAG